MQITDLDFTYPEHLVATEPQQNSRVLLLDKAKDFSQYQELNLEQLVNLFSPGDLLVVNDTKVLCRRIFAESNVEILFLKHISPYQWEVLFPAKKYKIGDEIILPNKIKMKLITKGRPQIVELDAVLNEEYFARYGELPLPPYIQKARNERHNFKTDFHWYQTFWAHQPGSFAAPTASLHFKPIHFQRLEQNGVQIKKLTLHVGLGTFLPVEVKDLNDHKMHFEYVSIPMETITAIHEVQKMNHRVWALGTTVTRALESQALGLLKFDGKHWQGDTNLLIQPGFNFKIVNGLLTNFHQPQSTLLALVAAFAGLEQVKSVYHFAIKNNFRLFSYGDLSVWIK